MAADFILDADIKTDKVQAKIEKLDKQFADSKRKIQEFETKITDSEGEMQKLVNRSEKLSESLKQAKEELAGFKQVDVTKLSGVEKEQYFTYNTLPQGYTSNETIATQKDKIKELQIEWEKVNEKIEDVNSEINKTNSKLELEKSNLNNIGSKIKDTVNKEKQLNSGWGKFKKNVDKTESSFKRFGKRFTTLVSSALFFTVVTKAFTAMRDSIGQILQKDKQLMKEWNQIKVNIQIIGEQLYRVIKPVLSWLMGILNTITQVASYIIETLFGKGAKSTKEMAEYMGDTADSAEKAGKSTASFDTLQTASSSGGDSSGNSDGLDYANANDIKTKTNDELAKISLISGIAMLGLGLILMLTGANIPLGLFLTVAGGLTVYKTIKENYGKMSAETQKELTNIMLIASSLLAVIGIILILAGQVPLGIGLLVAGIALFGGSAIATNKSGMSAETKKELGLIMEIASWAMLALGIIILLFANIALGLGLIVVAVVMMVAAAAVKNGGITAQAKAEIGAIMAIAGASLLALGIILCCTGVMIPLGVALIAAGAASLIGAVAINGNAILNWIKGVWKDIKKWWDATVAPIFTKEYWKNVFSKIGSGIKSSFKSLLNWIIGGLNKIGVTIPDYIPFIGGDRIGFDIPKLATGAVIPGGKPFVAMLGDQRAGQTNIEAPLDTIVEAFKQVAGGPQNITITAEGNMAQFIKMLNLKIKQEDNRASVW